MASIQKLTLADIAHVCPGTPGGKWFRRYWLAIGRCEDLKDIPQATKILGEELVLFRDLKGNIGLVGLNCPHRGTSLEYGDIEERGIRCPYHGWLFDASGQCLEQPAEPKGSTFYQKVKHLAYPVRELGGLIFAYMGPDKEDPPPLPRYSVLVRHDGARYTYPPRYCDFNWFNFYENAADLLHAYVLHKPSREHTRTFENKFWQYYSENGAPPLEVIATQYGVRAILHWTGPEADTEYFQQIDIAFPSVFSIGNEEIEEVGSERVLFTTPIDDEHSVVYRVDFQVGSNMEFLKKRFTRNVSPPSQAIKEYDKRKYVPFKGQTFKEDYVCMVTQGTIGYRQEHLATSDRGIILLRKLILEALETVQKGKSPKGVLSKERADNLFKLEGLRAVVPKSRVAELVLRQE